VDVDENGGGGRAATKRKARDAYMYTEPPKQRQKLARKHDMAEGEGTKSVSRRASNAAARAAAAPRKEKESCVICSQVFKAVQGVAPHYKSHMQKGAAEEKLVAERALAEFQQRVQDRQNRTAAAAAAARGKDAAPYDEDEDEDEEEMEEAADAQAPLALDPTALTCSHCSSRFFLSQVELIRHMLDEHGVYAVPAGQVAAAAAGPGGGGWEAAAAEEDAAPAPARFVANDAQLTRLIQLFDTGMAPPPRGDELRRLTTEIAALAPITEKQLAAWWQNRKSRLTQGKHVWGPGAAAVSGAGARAWAARVAAEKWAAAAAVAAVAAEKRAAVAEKRAAAMQKIEVVLAAAEEAKIADQAVEVAVVAAMAAGAGAMGGAGFGAVAAAAAADVVELTAHGLAGGSGGSGSEGRGLAVGADAAGSTRLGPMHTVQGVRMPEPKPDELSAWLKELKLDAYETKLREDLGGAFLEDLAGGLFSTTTRPTLNLLLPLRASV
jgi:hypothetical protein